MTHQWGNKRPIQAAMVAALAKQRGLAAIDAQVELSEMGKGSYEATRARAEKHQVEDRRRRAGNPVYRPRDDYTGQVRR